jgi:hypothetical protein
MSKIKKQRLPGGTWSLNKSRLEGKYFVQLGIISIKYDNSYIKRGVSPTQECVEKSTNAMQFFDKRITKKKVKQMLDLIGTGKSSYKNYAGYNDKATAQLELSFIRHYLMSL